MIDENEVHISTVAMLSFFFTKNEIQGTVIHYF
jgi:hypothetical protein